MWPDVRKSFAKVYDLIKVELPSLTWILADTDTDSHMFSFAIPLHFHSIPLSSSFKPLLVHSGFREWTSRWSQASKMVHYIHSLPHVHLLPQKEPVPLTIQPLPAPRNKKSHRESPACSLPGAPPSTRASPRQPVHRWSERPAAASIEWTYIGPRRTREEVRNRFPAFPTQSPALV